MRKKYSQSEENVGLGSVKLSEILRRNPRFPVKMSKVHKCNPILSRTSGQTSGKLPFPTTTFGRSNNYRGETVNPTSSVLEGVEEHPWTKLRRTFSNNKSPVPPNDGEETCASTDRYNFMRVLPNENQTAMLEKSPRTVLQNKTLAPVPQTESKETGVQVNMFHCKECRRHIKYGKSYKIENSCTESDSESIMCHISDYICLDCDRKDSDITVVEDIEDKEEHPTRDLYEDEEETQASDHEDVLDQELSSPRDESKNYYSSSFDGETAPNETDSTRMCKLSGLLCNLVGRFSLVTDTKLILLIALIMPLVFFIVQTQIFYEVFLAVNVYVRNLIGHPQVEESSSVFEQFIEFFFYTARTPKPSSLLVYLI